MVEVYGSSETAGIGWRDEPEEPYRLLPHWSVGDDGETLAREHPDGGSAAQFTIPDRLLWEENGLRGGGTTPCRSGARTSSRNASPTLYAPTRT